MKVREWSMQGTGVWVASCDHLAGPQSAVHLKPSVQSWFGLKRPLAGNRGLQRAPCVAALHLDTPCCASPTCCSLARRALHCRRKSGASCARRRPSSRSSCSRAGAAVELLPALGRLAPAKRRVQLGPAAGPQPTQRQQGALRGVAAAWS